MLTTEQRFWEDYFRQEEMREQQASFEAEQKAAVSSRFADRASAIRALGVDTKQGTVQ